MDIIITILILFILINTLLKLSFWKFRQVLIVSGLAGIFLYLVYPFAILQSQTEVKGFLQNSEILGNIAVLVTVESAVCICFCFTALLKYIKGKESKWTSVLKWYPGLLIFPVLFYLLTQSFFVFTGVDFQFIAVVFSVVAVVLIPVLSYGIRFLIPEMDLRLEIHFLMSLFVAVLGLIATTNGKIVYVAESEGIDFQKLIFTFVLFAVLFVGGFLLKRLQWRIFRKKQKYHL